MTVSGPCVGLAGSKRTRLLKHGMAGHSVEMVGLSWIAKPCGRSSRSRRLSVPPGFGVCDAGGACANAGHASTTTSAMALSRFMERKTTTGTDRVRAPRPAAAACYTRPVKEDGMRHKIALIPGDGIGKEVVPAAA